MSVHVLSNIFFRLFNAVALGALAVYVFKKYLLAGLQRTIIQRKALKAAQIKKNELVFQELQQLEGLFSEEKRQSIILLDAVHQWSAVVQKREKIAELEKLKLQQQEKQRSVKKEKELQRVMLQGTVGLPALAEARSEIINTFACSDGAQLFTNQVVSLIDELIR